MYTSMQQNCMYLDITQIKLDVYVNILINIIFSYIWNDFIRVVLFQIKIRLFIQIILIIILNFEFHILAELIGSSIL